MKIKPLSIFTTVVFILTFIVINSFSNPSERHIGQWKGVDNTGKAATIVLTETNDVKIVINNRTFGGKDFQMNGKRGEVKYQIDYSKTPTWIDFIVFVEENGQLKEKKERVKGILRFITDDKMEMRLSFTGERDSDFDSKDKVNTIVLDRVVE